MCGFICEKRHSVLHTICNIRLRKPIMSICRCAPSWCGVRWAEVSGALWTVWKRVQSRAQWSSPQRPVVVKSEFGSLVYLTSLRGNIHLDFFNCGGGEEPQNAICSEFAGNWCIQVPWVGYPLPQMNHRTFGGIMYVKSEPHNATIQASISDFHMRVQIWLYDQIKDLRRMPQCSREVKSIWLLQSGILTHAQWGLIATQTTHPRKIYLYAQIVVDISSYTLCCLGVLRMRLCFC